MESKWADCKNDIIKLRRKGWSLNMIEKRYGVAKSTMIGWFKNIELAPKYKKTLEVNRLNKLNNNRRHAVAWHNKQKENRLLQAKMSASSILKNINSNNTEIIKLFLASIYLGEGHKKDSGTGMGNSDPDILRFFVECLVRVYKIEKSMIKFELHLRADQDGMFLKKYWAEQLNLPLENCGAISYDKRTIGKPTYPGYNGVCVVRAGSVAIQRELVYLSKGFIEKFLRD